jgi:outer membrane protein TolC
MKRVGTPLAVFLALSSAQISFADTNASGSLSLDMAINEALHDSPTIQSSEAAVSRGKWQQFEAVGAGFLPRITAGFTHYLGENYESSNINFGGSNLAFPAAFPTNMLTINAVVPLFDGFANINHLQAAALEKTAAEQELDRAKFELSQQVKLAFYQALAAALLQDVARENVKTLEDHLKEVEIQRNGGAATQYDTLRVSVQLSEGRADAIDADDNAVLARKKLNTLLGLEQDDRPLVGALPEPDPSRAKDLELSGVPVDRTDIQALESREEAASKTSNEKNLWLVPSVSLGGQFNYYEVMNESTVSGTVSGSGNYQSAYNIALLLSWNLFDGGVSLAKGREASYQHIQEDKKAEQAKIEVPYDFAYWKKRFLSNTDHYKTRKYDVERSQESVRLAKEEERAGTRTSTETLDAELDLFRSRAGVVNAQVNALEAQIRLESTLGRAI